MKNGLLTKSCCILAILWAMTGCNEVANYTDDAENAGNTDIKDNTGTSDNISDFTFVPNTILNPEDVSVPAETAPTIDAANCVNIDLSSPESSDDSVVVTSKSGKISISIESENKTCVRLAGAFDGTVSLETIHDIDVDLILDSVHITSSEHAGALKLKTANPERGNTYLVELNGENVISGNETSDSKKVVASDTNLSITGTGKLAVNAHYKTGIGVDDVRQVKRLF